MSLFKQLEYEYMINGQITTFNWEWKVGCDGLESNCIAQNKLSHTYLCMNTS